PSRLSCAWTWSVWTSSFGLWGASRMRQRSGNGSSMPIMRPSPDQTLSGRSAAYRADIDGLRGISVLAVIGFHGFPDLVPGGFIGVDVFFVISGFLISGIIFDEMQSDVFSLRSFYARRIRRIFPALVLVLTVTVFVGWSILLPQDMLRLARQLLSSAAFVANF